MNFALARKKSGWTAQHRQKEEQDRLDSERERGELEAEIRAPLKRNGWNMNHGCSLRRLHRRHLLIGLKQASLPGEIPMVPLAPKPAEPEPAHGVAGKRPLKQLIAFFAIAAFTVGVRTVHPSPTANATPRILEEKAPPTPEVASRRPRTKPRRSQLRRHPSGRSTPRRPRKNWSEQPWTTPRRKTLG